MGSLKVLWGFTGAGGDHRVRKRGYDILHARRAYITTIIYISHTCLMIFLCYVQIMEAVTNTFIRPLLDSFIKTHPPPRELVTAVARARNSSQIC